MEDRIYHKGLVLHFTRRNAAGRRPIILIGGWCSTQEFWKPNWEDWGHLGTIYTLDLPGHFPSEIIHTEEELELEDFLGAIAEGIFKIARGRRPILIGHSTGGMAVLAIAKKYPRRIHKVISFSPFIHGPISKGLSLWAEMGGQESWARVFDTTFKAAQFNVSTLKYLFAVGVGNRKEFLKRPDVVDYMHSYYPFFSKLNPRYVRSVLHLLHSLDLRNQFGNYRKDTLVVVGEKDRIVANSQSSFLKDIVTRYEVLHGIGHFPQLEDRFATKALVESFVQFKKPVVDRVKTILFPA